MNAGLPSVRKLEWDCLLAEAPAATFSLRRLEAIVCQRSSAVDRVHLVPSIGGGPRPGGRRGVRVNPGVRFGWPREAHDRACGT